MDYRFVYKGVSPYLWISNLWIWESAVDPEGEVGAEEEVSAADVSSVEVEIVAAEEVAASDHADAGELPQTGSAAVLSTIG